MSPAPIVLVMPDQLRADALGAAGNAFVHTPNLDRLAIQSVRFETCITSAPLCRPARISMMTATPVHAHGFDTNLRVPAPTDVPSHVRRLRDEAGYHTMVVGKTHLHDGTGHLDDHRGVLHAWGYSEARELPDAQQHWVRSGHSDWLTATTPSRSIDKFERWRDYTINHRLGSSPPDAEPWRLSTEDHLDSFCARSAAAWIRSYAGTRPFYLQVNFPGPHPPFDPTREFLSALDPNDPALPLPPMRASTGPSSPAALRYRRRRGRRWTEAELRLLRTTYYAKVALVDAGIGLVLEALADTGLSNEAWIIVCSDHGELLGDHGLTGKVLAYDAAIRIPLVVRPPGGVEGWVDRGDVDLGDVVATIIEIAGLESQAPGGSLLERVVHGPTGASAHQRKRVRFGAMGYTAVRSDRATLTWDRELDRAVELFDRRSDPFECHNRIEDPAYAELRDELVEQLHSRA